MAISVVRRVIGGVEIVGFAAIVFLMVAEHEWNTGSKVVLWSQGLWTVVLILTGSKMLRDGITTWFLSFVGLISYMVFVCAAYGGFPPPELLNSERTVGIAQIIALYMTPVALLVELACTWREWAARTR